ncbi:TetR/AcrR family transcriptional regulator [Paenibacillus taichungensis]|uniref:TetR/AcrR family transcriptional regulator n=1 Tax=Paenibacillus taichungensis TaxID=484184 RepID=UPI002DBC8563|nr:TetR/AcrR family transcriptional regulator [Paenibacillus taichungensis]MEC0111521.1 TetR/AcrR family transcriptional regulator [Paenibacillus taichungensis]MEC0196968.1 TetR/AcrR family transcriptional regulator [Paenibacillus taichungensis]
MNTIDRRIIKSQKAIKSALVELMSEKNFDEITLQDISNRADVSRRTIYLHYLDKYDLLDKIIEEHIEELKRLCEIQSEEENTSWFDYFHENQFFFNSLLSSKGASFFRSQLLEFVVSDMRSTWKRRLEGENKGINDAVLLQFFGTAYVGIVEWWFRNDMPHPPCFMEEQMGILLERNLSPVFNA